MRIKKTETREVDVIHRLCDAAGCGKEITSRYCWACKVCGGDFCDEHSTIESDETGDDARFCTDCWLMGQQFREQIADATEAYEKQMDVIQKAWRDATAAAKAARLEVPPRG